MSETNERLLAGRVALLTGSAQGLGRAIAHRFAAAGAIGMAWTWTARRPRLLHRRDGSAPRRTCATKAVCATRWPKRSSGWGARCGRCQCGLGSGLGGNRAVDLAAWDEVFAVNVRGVIATVKSAVPAMKAKGGSIILMGSLNSWRAHAQQCLYVASKHAVLGIARSTALELGGLR